MEVRDLDVVPLGSEVQEMIEPDMIRQIRELTARGGPNGLPWSSAWTVSPRTVQRVVADLRREQRAADVASVRFETDPGYQVQSDFGQKQVRIAGTVVRAHLLVAVLSHSRRLFVKALLSERQDDWREGIAEAFRHLRGVPRTVLWGLWRRPAASMPWKAPLRALEAVGGGLSDYAAVIGEVAS